MRLAGPDRCRRAYLKRWNVTHRVPKIDVPSIKEYLMIGDRLSHGQGRRDRQMLFRQPLAAMNHRLANVRHADVIYVLDSGRLLEHGTHQQLIAAHGRYAELFALQSRGYQSSSPESL